MFAHLSTSPNKLQQSTSKSENPPSPSQMPPHAEGTTDDESLHQHPNYKFPHTATFLQTFSPQAEQQILAEFAAAQHNPSSIPLPATATFTLHQSSNPESCINGGWTAYLKDMVAMGLDWAVKRLGLHASEIEPTIVMHGKDRTMCVRNGGGATSFLPLDIYDETGDTDEDEDEEFVNRYLGRSEEYKIPVVSVFGEGYVVERSIGGKIYGVAKGFKAGDSREIDLQ